MILSVDLAAPAARLRPGKRPAFGRVEDPAKRPAMRVTPAGGAYAQGNWLSTEVTD